MNPKTAIRQLQQLQKLGGKEGMRLAAEEWSHEWQTLISIIMSARTRDETTVKVAEKLFAKFPTVAALATASAAEVSAIIRPVNFFRNKTKSVITCARMLAEHFKGMPPHEINKLILLPGVGRKTANVFLAQYGHQAIGVDTHVAHISQKLGWTKHANPHKIEKDLERLFPRQYWSRVNGACVRFGKTYQSRKAKNKILEALTSETGRGWRTRVEYGRTKR